ncbi:GrdX family protein [Sedimentibacter hydroxybenzoicus DSM 7310]|uniref:GrdX family protein n=1 Tax=Sedimentibacter hydroxybenzoicus DSM 7310 TaxID=1123245 RepID=A0A974GXX2_SEDHY|nr:GrdX family protein [Sedimentibacter hydroxybenzoicus]NYB75505.1 GrdX family protein [Sedimentibacter hydroxybenzoicus DSM 7310]
MIITNNDWVYQKFKDSCNVLFIKGSYRDVLVKVRDKIQEGHELLTHPLSSSLKPNETPYKSIIISENKGTLNFDSVYIIENSIMSYDKFNKNKLINLTDKIIEDFKLIDLTVLESALDI